MSARSVSPLSMRFYLCGADVAAVGCGGRAGARLRQNPDHRLGRRRSRGAGAAIVTIPRWGRSPSRRVPDRESAEVGGLQNTVANLGASPGTALVGAVLIARRDNIAVAVGLSYNRPSGGSRPLRRKRRKCREPSLTPITNCPL